MDKCKASGKPDFHYWHRKFKLKEEKCYFYNLHVGPTCDRSCVSAESWHAAQMQMAIQMLIPNDTQIHYHV
jgi:hypothetical protein